VIRTGEKSVIAPKLSDDGRMRLAQDLGAFLATLHGLVAPVELIDVVDPNQRADMTVRVPRARDMIDRVRSDCPDAVCAEPILIAAEALAPDPRRVLSHGDLHLRQILVTDVGRLSGVVDWVDICVAPPSLDLSVLWSLFSPRERSTFLTAYGPADPDTLLRARVLAMFLSAALAAYARDHGWAHLWREALAGLHRALLD
jgi:aminoglycoside phosphotransferase (APT) family kinase protein